MFLILSFIWVTFSSAQTSINENFETFQTRTWTQGSTYGSWKNEYHGYGRVGIEKESSSRQRVLFQKPMASTEYNETHASLVLTKNTYKTPTFVYTAKTMKQLRTPVPNPWETAWGVWNYTHDHSFYYFALKTNGWELGKVDNTKIDPAGPECLWPTYRNCMYDGAQRYLATGGSPRDTLNKWYQVRIVQTGNRIQVYVEGRLVVSYVDRERPYLKGKAGFYNEDAYVRFDNISLKSGAQ